MKSALDVFTVRKEYLTNKRIDLHGLHETVETYTWLTLKYDRFTG